MALVKAIVVVILVREADPFRLDLRALRVHRVQLRKLLQIGVISPNRNYKPS